MTPADRDLPNSSPTVPSPSGRAAERVFLVVADDSEEMKTALRYAARRAQHTGGRVALLRVIEPTDLQPWGAVEALMREELRQEAEALLHTLSAEVIKVSGTIPALYIREGKRRDELLALIDEEPTISILVLAASLGNEGPGPLVTALTGKMIGGLRVPLTIVPGNLTDEQIDLIA